MSKNKNRCPTMEIDDTFLFEGHVYKIKREDGVSNGTINPTIERIT